MEQISTTLVDLPDKVIAKILSYIPSKEVQSKRTVCSQWNRTIESEFGILIIVKNGNYKAMLACGSATTAKFHHFTLPFTEEVSFSRSLTTAEFVGEIGRSNIVQLLKSCSNIENLQFSNVFFVDVYSRVAFDDITLPLMRVKFVVNFFQDRFCMAELIIIDLLTRIQSSYLSTIIVQIEDPMSTVRFNFMHSEMNFPDILELGINDIQEPVPHEQQSQPQTPADPEEADQMPLMNVNIALRIPNNQQNEGEGGGNVQEENPPPELQHENGIHNFVAIGMTMWDDGVLFPIMVRQVGNNSPSAHPHQPFPVSSDIFTEFMLQNHRTLKNFVTNIAEFRCLGDISHWDETRLRDIQLENISYSFGGTRDDNGEYLLLKNQHSLKSLDLFMMHDDLDSEHFWEDISQAITSSHETLQNIDLTIFSEEDWVLDLQILSTCNQLKKFIFNHYSRKSGIELLPTSLEHLKLNGTLIQTQLISIAHRLKNLKIFEFHLNMEGAHLDMQFFRTILSNPKIQRMSFFACNIEQQAMQFLRNTPGLVTHEEYTFSLENSLVIIKVEPNYQRNFPVAQV